METSREVLAAYEIRRLALSYIRSGLPTGVGRSAALRGEAMETPVYDRLAREQGVPHFEEPTVPALSSRQRGVIRKLQRQILEEVTRDGVEEDAA